VNVNDHVVRDYIDAVMRLHDGVQENVDAQMLGEIATSLGLDPGDMARVNQEAERVFQRGLNYLDREMWDEAAEDLATAAALAPDSVEVLGAFAQALDGRWWRDRDKSDGLQARALSRRCLEQDTSHQSSYAILKRHGEVERRQQVLFRTGVVAIVVSGVFFSIWLARSGESVKSISDEDQAMIQEVGSVSVSASSSDSVERERVVPRRQSEIPVAVISGQIEGLEVEIRSMRWSEDREGTIEDPDSEPKVHLVGVVENLGSRTIGKVDMRLSLSDRNEEVIARRKFVALGSHEASLRPGDRQAFSQSIAVEDVAFLRAALEVELVEHQAFDNRNTAIEITPNWAIPGSGEWRLWIGEREEVRSAASSGNEVYHKAVWEFQNLGLEPITQLGVEVEYVDSDDVVLEREKRWFVYDGGAQLMPGEKRQIRVVAKVSNRQENYLLRVVAVQ
jgi:hypothetical protein